ncbi:MAG: hypothetical protein CL946_01155 [Ectothiorhodospiraceae bacterium]|nr:hypothetical protein [Ectothiorhodospiraceae bacterium]
MIIVAPPATHPFDADATVPDTAASASGVFRLYHFYKHIAPTGLEEEDSARDSFVYRSRRCALRLFELVGTFLEIKRLERMPILHRLYVSIIAMYMAAALSVFPLSLHAQIPQQYNTGVTLDLPQDAEPTTIHILSITGERLDGELVHASYSGHMLLYNSTDSPTAPVDIYVIPIQGVDSVSFRGNSYAWESAAIAAPVSVLIGTLLHQASIDVNDKPEPSIEYGLAAALFVTPLTALIGAFIHDDGPGKVIHTKRGYAEALDHLQDYDLYDGDDPVLVELIRLIEEAEENDE